MIEKTAANNTTIRMSLLCNHCAEDHSLCSGVKKFSASFIQLDINIDYFVSELKNKWDKCINMGSVLGGYVHYLNIYWPPLVANIDGIPIQILRDYPPNKTQCLSSSDIADYKTVEVNEHNSDED